LHALQCARVASSTGKAANSCPLTATNNPNRNAVSASTSGRVPSKPCGVATLRAVCTVLTAIAHCTMAAPSCRSAPMLAMRRTHECGRRSLSITSQLREGNIPVRAMQ
jgi:hypothetical protein